ncbi:MAG: metal ABC transporter ATP-binding protein [Burkholderiaceae bacterium]
MVVAGSLPLPGACALAAADREAIVFELDEVALGYRGDPVISRLTGSFDRASMTAIVGPNGAGKTTLLKALLGTVAPLSGRIRRLASPRDIAYLPQLSGVDRAFPITVGDFVSTGLWSSIGSFRAVDRRQSDRIDEAIANAGLAGGADAWLQDLSGGQFQRARFARLSLQDAPVVLLDEPFAAIDHRTVDDLMSTITRWHAEGRTIAVVMHDLELVRRHFPRTLALGGADIAWGDTSSSLAAIQS